MIIGIGCDICEISRLKESLDKFGEKFLHRIFTKYELANAPINTDKYYSYLAKRFAAKEAFAKALGTGIGENVLFSEIEILNNELGKPYIKTIDRLAAGNKIHLTLSDETHFAVAFVVIENDPTV